MNLKKKVGETATNLSVTIAATILMLLLLELGLRAYEGVNGRFECNHNFYDLHVGSENDVLGFELRKNHFSDYECANNIINSQGIRVGEAGKTFGPKKRYRIAVVGDSVTYGYARAYGETYPAQLEKYLNLRGYDVEVVNLGVSAYDLRQYVERIKTVSNELEPDYLVIGYTHRDHRVDKNYTLNPFDQRICKLPYLGNKINCKWVHELNNIRTLIFLKTRIENMKEEETGFRFQKHVLPDEGREYEMFQAEIERLSNTWDTEKTLVAVFPLAIHWGEYDTLRVDEERISTLFRQHNITTINLYDHFQILNQSEDDIADGADYVHYSPLGYEKAAKAIGDYMIEYGKIR